MRLHDPFDSSRRAAAGAPAAPEVPLATDRTMMPPPPARRGPRVLLVDDEPDALNSVRSLLDQAGYRVTSSGNLRLAIHTLENEPFDLVLTDLYLGSCDLGYQVAEAARQRRPAVPVILMTGRPTFDGAQEALRSKVAEIVVKPFEAQTLLGTCRRVLQETELARRNQELESVNRVLSSVLPRTIEIKDPTTSGHAARVVGYVDTLATRCGVPAEQRASLRLAALCHDIGKIGVPDQILTKPGPLTADEFEVVKRHPAMGYEVLAPLEGHEDVRNWVYQHHERWDGRGYPQGLHGEEVALPGRILVLAEVYDALAEVRSYKAAWPVAKIAGLFREEAGKHFDPDLAMMVADGLDRQGSRFFAPEPGFLF